MGRKPNFRAKVGVKVGGRRKNSPAISKSAQIFLVRRKSCGFAPELRSRVRFIRRGGRNKTTPTNFELLPRRNPQFNPPLLDRPPDF